MSVRLFLFLVEASKESIEYNDLIVIGDYSVSEELGGDPLLSLQLPLRPYGALSLPTPAGRIALNTGTFFAGYTSAFGRVTEWDYGCCYFDNLDQIATFAHQ